jgi:hypothetical protein
MKPVGQPPVRPSATPGSPSAKALSNKALNPQTEGVPFPAWKPVTAVTVLIKTSTLLRRLRLVKVPALPDRGTSKDFDKTFETGWARRWKWIK